MGSVPACCTTGAEGNLQRVLSVVDPAEDGIALSFYFRYGDLEYEGIAEPKQRFCRSTLRKAIAKGVTRHIDWVQSHLLLPLAHSSILDLQ